ncbi:MAG: transglycosylase domain-containing protein [Albidovulum sp.]|nr:transglycosylase domain-containing protein [Albidovulum sp.]
MVTEQRQAENSRGGKFLRRPLKAVKWVARTFVAVFAIWMGLAATYSFVNPPTNIHEIYEFFRLGGIQREWVEFEDVPPHVHRTLVAAEDANFCLHWGFDPEAIRKSIAQGGNVGVSTISQQTAAATLLWPSESRSLRLPITLATFGVEAFWSKRRILEVYMNMAEFGEGVFGIQAAAQEYFGLDAANLDMDHASRLAAVLIDPRNLDANDLSPGQARRTAVIADGALTIALDGRATCFET